MCFRVPILLFFTCFLLVAYQDSSAKKPKLSILTSVYNGDAFIEAFLEDIIQQTIFDQCELILINANSPGHEEEVIKKYLPRYPNIKYVKLKEDPGVYGVWNYAIKMASADLVMSGNLDDRSKSDAFEKHVEFLEANPSIDLVYAGYFVTENPNETFEENSYKWVVDPREFEAKYLFECLPGPRPVWRKSVHERFGYFDETYLSAGDIEMWNRMARQGSLFKKLPGIYSLYYLNPSGLSTDKEEAKIVRRTAEEMRVREQYGHMWK